MDSGLPIKNNIVIPFDEIEITTSRSSGAGGQHVNKTSTKVTVRWNVRSTRALDELQKNQILQKLQSRLTTDGDLIVHSSESRSQQANKKTALARLAQEIKKALHVPKKRKKTGISAKAKEVRKEQKSRRSEVKKMRKKIDY